ncbi:MAG: Uma2 family endonuclease [Anaerolineae bacterium]
MTSVTGALAGLGEKRDDYARAGIHEHWLIDPEAGSAQCLVLTGDGYAVNASSVGTDPVASVLLEGFAIQPSALFA